MKLPAALTKLTGQPRCAQRVEIAMYSLGILVEELAPLADVDRRLAGVADPVDDRDHGLAVGLRDVVLGAADALPALLGAVEDRRDGEADHRQRDRRDGGAAEAPGRRARRRRDGSSSRPRTSPRAWASPAGCPGLGCPPLQPRKVRKSGEEVRYGLPERSLKRLRPDASRLGAGSLAAAAAAPPRAGRRRPANRLAGPRSRRSCAGLAPVADGGRGRQPKRRASAATRRPRARRPGAVAAVDRRREGDQVGEQRHRREVAELGEALEPERVEVVAAEQREVRRRRRRRPRPVS